jgi:hypothetical protein
MFQTKVVEKTKTHILPNMSPPSHPENRAVCVHVQEYGTAGEATDGNIIRCMRFACWITKATDTDGNIIWRMRFAG